MDKLRFSSITEAFSFGNSMNPPPQPNLEQPSHPPQPNIEQPSPQHQPNLEQPSPPPQSQTHVKNSFDILFMKLMENDLFDRYVYNYIIIRHPYWLKNNPTKQNTVSSFSGISKNLNIMNNVIITNVGIVMILLILLVIITKLMK
jgi:hypothetical protein